MLSNSMVGEKAFAYMESLNQVKTNDGGEDVVKTIAKLLKVDVNDCDIQRAHRLGKKKRMGMM